MRRLVAILAASVLTLALAGPALGGSRAPATYYLSLGDSLAAGQQPTGDWSRGYADQLYQWEKLRHPTLRHEKLGCAGGETTTTFRFGGICTYPHGSQLAEAMAFLAAHPTPSPSSRSTSAGTTSSARTARRAWPAVSP